MAKCLSLSDDSKVLNLLRSNNIECIEDLLREKQIPNKHGMIAAISECGYNKNIQYLLKRMSDMLKRDIPDSVGSWCGYRPDDPNCPVFVVTLENPNCVLDKNRICKPFLDYDIIVRFKHVPNDEEKTILENTGNKRARGKDDARVHTCIANNTDSLMQEHSNLSIIRGSYVKSRGYLTKAHEVVNESCIVLSVPVKGIIPIGEREFETSIDGIPTDVREGEFVLFAGHSANCYHDHLRMGCCISSPDTGMFGTCGGYVQLPGNKIGCLTAAHVVVTKEEINNYGKQADRKGPINDDLKYGPLVLTTYQPQAHVDSYCGTFGNVHTIALPYEVSSRSLDAAIIAITNDKINPETIHFPEGDFIDEGFPIDETMTFNSGENLDPIPSSQRGSSVIKFGSTTGITRGCLGWTGTSARVTSELGNYYFPTLLGQLEVISRDFATYGDSGALAFTSYGGHVDNLHSIGMVIGGSSTGCSSLITPIRGIFQELGLSENQFKLFPPNL